MPKSYGCKVDISGRRITGWQGDRMTNEEYHSWLTDADPAEIPKVLRDIERIIKLRNLALTNYEYIILDKLKKQEITSFNISAKKGKLTKILKESGNLQLQCRILRKNIFFLQARKRLLLAHLKEINILKPVTANSFAEKTDKNEQGNPN